MVHSPLVGGAVEVAIEAQAQPALGSISVSAIEVEQIGERARRTDPEDVSKTSAPRSRGPIDVSILSLGKQTGIVGATAIGVVEVPHVGIGLCAKQRANNEKDQRRGNGEKAIGRFHSSAPGT